MTAATRIQLADEPPLRIGALVVEPAARTVIGQDGTSERLEPRVMQVLVRLSRGGVVGRDDLIECCWAGQIVGEDAINRVISRLRRLAEERHGVFHIETIPRVGYRMIADVAPVAHPEPPPAPGLPAQVPALTLIRQGDARRRKFWVRWAAAGTLLSVAMAGLAGEALRARADARARRADAEQLVEFMLGDLRKRLDAVGRLDVLDSVGAQTMAYYARQDLGSLNADELARRAKALRMVGQLREQRGDFGAAEASFEQAAKTTSELMAREPNKGQRIFDHAQSVYYVGYIALRRGDLRTAAQAFDDYARMADRLVTLDPKNDDWRAEVAYSRSNRGTMEFRARQFDAANIDFRHATEVMQSLVQRHPDNVQWRNDFADFNAWTADTERFRGRLQNAIDARRRSLQVLSKMAAANPLDNSQLADLARTHRALGNLAMDVGDSADAIKEYNEAEHQFGQLLEVEPNNVDILSGIAHTDNDFAEALIARGRAQDANERLQHAIAICAKLTALDPQILEWRQTAAATNLIAAEFALTRGDISSARILGTPAADELAREARTGRPLPDSLLWQARGLALKARATGDDRQIWNAIVQTLRTPKGALRLDEACLLRQAYIRLGQTAEAAPIGSRLEAANYARPGCNGSARLTVDPGQKVLFAGTR